MHTVVWQCRGHGNAWHCHGMAVALPWHCHGTTMAMHATAVALPWRCHGIFQGAALAVPWECHGHAMALALPWQCHCNAMAMPWQGHGQSKLLTSRPLPPSAATSPEKHVLEKASMSYIRKCVCMCFYVLEASEHFFGGSERLFELTERLGSLHPSILMIGPGVAPP